MQERLPWIISTPTFLLWSSSPADNCTKQVSYLRNAGRVPTVIPLENHWDPLFFSSGWHCKTKGNGFTLPVEYFRIYWTPLNNFT